MTTFGILIESDLTEEQMLSVVPMGTGVDARGTREVMNDLSAYFAALAGGARDYTFFGSAIGATYASATFTVSSTGSANAEAGSILGETLTAVTSGATPADGEFDISTTPATQAANIAATINAMPAVVPIVTATVEGAVVTITPRTPGFIGNGLEISVGDLANVALSSGGFTGGTGGTGVNVYNT